MAVVRTQNTAYLFARAPGETNAYFFEEGTAKRYEAAQYGELRVAPDGELLLTGLRGKDLKPL